MGKIERITILIRELLEKIEVWWVKNVEIPTNPDFDGVVINGKDIRPGRVIALDYVISIAVADYLRSDDHVNNK